MTATRRMYRLGGRNLYPYGGNISERRRSNPYSEANRKANYTAQGVSQSDQDVNMWSSTVGGAASGALGASAAGPWGMLAGAVIGGASGYFSASGQEKAQDRQQADQQRMLDREFNEGRDIYNQERKNEMGQLASDFSFTAAYGGKLPNRRLGNGGALQPVSQEGQAVVGPSHEQGGVPIGNNTEVEGNEFIYEDMVFSDRLPYKGGTFAMEATRLASMKGTTEKGRHAMKSVFDKNGMVREGQKLDSQLKQLFAQQEQTKQVMGIEEGQAPEGAQPQQQQQVGAYGMRLGEGELNKGNGKLNTDSINSLPNTLPAAQITPQGIQNIPPVNYTNLTQNRTASGVPILNNEQSKVFQNMRNRPIGQTANQTNLKAYGGTIDNGAQRASYYHGKMEKPKGKDSKVMAYGGVKKLALGDYIPPDQYAAQQGYTGINTLPKQSSPYSGVGMAAYRGDKTSGTSQYNTLQTQPIGMPAGQSFGQPTQQGFDANIDVHGTPSATPDTPKAKTDYTKYAGQAASYLENFVNQGLLASAPRIPQARMNTAVPLTRTYNNADELAAIKATGRNRRKDIERNFVDANVANRLKSKAYSDELKGISASNASKQKIEISLKNADDKNKQAVMNQNAQINAKYDQQVMERTLGIQQGISANITNLGEDIQSGFKESNQRQLDKDKLSLIYQQMKLQSKAYPEGVWERGIQPEIDSYVDMLKAMKYTDEEIEEGTGLKVNTKK